jgi:hypothetical protein
MLISNTSSGSLGTYSLDGASSSPLIVPGAGTGYPIYNFELLTAVPASEGPHTLEITASSASAFYLDYILLETRIAFVTEVLSSSGAGSGSRSGGGGNGTTGGDGGDGGITGGGGGGSTRSANVGTIAGGVVGGVVVLVAIGLAIFFWMRRRQRRTYNTRGTLDLAAEDRYTSVGGYDDAQARGQGQGVPMEMYQRQRTESGMCQFHSFYLFNAAAHVVALGRTRLHYG